MKNKGIDSYFMQSLFVDGFTSPCGSNIAPKRNNDQNCETGFKYMNHKYGCDSFNMKTLTATKTTRTIIGSIKLFENKEYNRYYNKEINKMYECSADTFDMDDEIKFESRIEVLDESTVVVDTVGRVRRNVTGTNFSGNSCRDGMLPEMSYEDSEQTIEVKEYFQRISDGRRLVHYSEYSPFFEIYDLPETWNIFDGILLCPKVFDDVEYDKKDESLEELTKIRDNNKSVKLLIKR